MRVEEISAFGWPNCLSLSNDDVELIASTAVGPRILRYSRRDGENVLRTFPEQMGRSGEADYQVRGGHRLWAAPETSLTYRPDNGPVEVLRGVDGAVTLANRGRSPDFLRKELSVSLEARGSRVTLRHRLVNEGSAPLRVATWGLTVVATGGWQIIPQPPLGSHDTDLQPDRLIVPWPYTDFSDPRWRFGTRFWQLHPRPGLPPTKMGFALPSCWVGYFLPRPLQGELFLKTFPFDHDAAYPDFGCNYETFCKGDFLELESLGVWRSLAPGEATEHVETWHLITDTRPPFPLDDAALAEWLKPHLRHAGIP